MKHDTRINDTAMRLRAERAKTLAYALGETDPYDAASICAAYLEGRELGGPQLDPFERTAADARLFFASAPPHEAAAYAIAGLERLPNNHHGLATRKRAIAALWETLPRSERLAFLGRVDAEGRFRSKVAAT